MNGEEAFERALQRTLAFEGVYSSDPRDPGGETVFGIARRRWANWKGWAIVDALKAATGSGKSLLERLRESKELGREVAAFYLAVFWRPIGCDSLRDLAPAVAAKLFDAGVNLGAERAVELLQATLAGLGRDLAIDGHFGPDTLAAAQSVCSDPGGAEAILAGLRASCRAYYAGLIRGNPRLAVYERGWYRRAAS